QRAPRRPRRLSPPGRHPVRPLHIRHKEARGGRVLRWYWTRRSSPTDRMERRSVQLSRQSRPQCKGRSRRRPPGPLKANGRRERDIRMRICIFGAGAVGSHFAVRLALAGHEVACVMRGAHLQAVQAKGLTLRIGEAEFHASVTASDNPATLGQQDLVISTLKATSVGSLAYGLPPLLAADTPVVLAQNGIPWWYDIGLPKDHPPPPDLSFLDPGGRLRAKIGKERIIGGVIFSSNEVVAPGVVAGLSPDRNRLVIGECDDRASDRVGALRAMLEAAKLESPPVAQIREAIWSKLLTNMSLSVLC